MASHMVERSRSAVALLREATKASNVARASLMAMV
eukprot:CAMPEP_0179162164 /NCGR_PEP_ID=MMETSP0796-20121207/79426_1 /TAXON_ID=73915 /ORGANISM="Pyrodinium bahamense, Strain pbaha01" /LENGTH=34 /DNA_ID= /DNA_START= /DNA_END= /DNA_ORIENTATION=